ncbi:hypothetical protein HU200_060403 [Digitaria exilis]|uniref:BHLH domain-containing protein n=1 Tax=Digitaria exilis TaxID=1010633 RepID=A0A835A6L9_9POAL|nr:hypothetical protein HU200_060403 [Digitaria exilis]
MFRFPQRPRQSAVPQRAAVQQQCPPRAPHENAHPGTRPAELTAVCAGPIRTSSLEAGPTHHLLSLSSPSSVHALLSPHPLAAAAHHLLLASCSQQSKPNPSQRADLFHLVFSILHRAPSLPYLHPPVSRLRARRDEDPSVDMKSRRQSSGGSSAGATPGGEGNTHSSGGGGGGCKLERKDVEKNRRLHMKGLCLKLSSLIPPAARHASLLSEAAASASNPNKVKIPLHDSDPSQRISAVVLSTAFVILAAAGHHSIEATKPTLHSPRFIHPRAQTAMHPLGSPRLLAVAATGGPLHSRWPAPAVDSDAVAHDTVTQLDQLDSAAAYIKQLKERIESLKRSKAGGGLSGHVAGTAAVATGVAGAAVRMPVIEARYQDGTLDVVLISEAGRPFKLHEVITVLEQEGAEVVSASFSVVGDKIFYTIHSQALSPRIGLDATRVSERLQDLLHLV